MCWLIVRGRKRRKKKGSPFVFTAQKSTLCYDPSSGYLHDFASPSTLCFHLFFSFMFFSIISSTFFLVSFVKTEENKNYKENCLHKRNLRHAHASPHTHTECMHNHSSVLKLKHTLTRTHTRINTQTHTHIHNLPPVFVYILQ